LDTRPMLERIEAMSIVVLEAGITGTPVLLTDRSGFDEVEKVEGGRVVPVSVEGLRHGLVELLGRPDALGDMGGNLRRLVRDGFTWDSVIAEYLALYDRVLGRRKARAKRRNPRRYVG
jgi:glycosyltransferase involved in cell wall biosynthesis